MLRGTIIRAANYVSMSKCNTDDHSTIFPNAKMRTDRERDTNWIEIFKDRIAEDLKQVLQEDMEWTTSRPILERLNRLRDVEKARLRGNDGLDPAKIRKAS